MPAHDPKIVAERLEASRRNLLDLSRRNRLIHYRPSRTVGAEIVGESPAEILRQLVVAGRAMTFSGKPDRVVAAAPEQSEFYIHDYGDPASLQRLREEAEKELDDFVGSPIPKADPKDLVLNTEETKSALRNRLLKTYRDARTIVEESGVNVLFLALGMLEWRELEDPDAVRRAPLVLVPVSLEPKADGTFRLRYDGGEVGGNLSLQALLSQEFGLPIPSLPEVETLDINAYFSVIRETVDAKPDWKVDTGAVSLGFFSYAKYLLYADLDEERWPADRKPALHSIMGALLDSGFEDLVGGISEDAFLDDLRPLEITNDVTDADGSQVLAILEAGRGQSMVLQGPPGTGKSQTITNLLADALARGKKVLFVAEKLAALDVVARRMEEAGLRDACLELHSHKAKKTEFYRELRRTVDLGQPRLEELHTEMRLLEQHRDRLNAYSEAVNTLILGRDISPRDAMGGLILLGAAPAETPRLAPEAMEGWEKDRFRSGEPLVAQLQAKVDQIGSPAANPFFGSRLTILLPIDRQQVFGQIALAATALAKARASTSALAARLGLPEPKSLADAAAICRGAQRAAVAPELDGVAINTATWKDHASRLRATIEAGRRLSALHREFDGRLRPEAWAADLTSVRDQLNEHGRKWNSFMIGGFRQAKGTLDGLCLVPGNSLEDRLRLCEAAIEGRTHARELTEASTLASGMFGVQWQREGSDWDSLSSLLDWILELHRDVGSGDLPPGMLNFLQGKFSVDGLAGQAEAGLVDVQKAIEALRVCTKSLAMAQLPSALLDSFEEGIALLASWETKPDDLEDLIGFNKLYAEASERGMTAVAELAGTWPDAGKRLGEMYRRSWFELVLREAFKRPALATFDRSSHEEAIREFRKLDLMLLAANRARIALTHFQRIPRSFAGGTLGWLQHEMAKKTRQASIRKSMAEAGDVIQAIKPIFMMSPLSVAQYLPPEGPQFDLVIFDEASQVKPEDAFGAILRGSQVIVVGDSKQMPPTSFFERMTAGDESGEDEEAYARNVTRDMESVLSLMDSKIAPKSPRRRMLLWHYRSRHHSLIAVSNARFYEYRLKIFPNPTAPDAELGLLMHHLPDTIYDRGGSRTNKGEAKAVADAVIAQVHDRPEQSLMVVAFSQAQQMAIQDELDRRGSDPAFAAYSQRHPVERLEVKNLENVQGDERDVVFISVGYGRDKGEAQKVAMNFGPINLEGGERRLNVLISRARVRCEVFTNLASDDIRTDATASQGVSALKAFLHYAETGDLERPVETGLETMSPFEDAVRLALQKEGYEIEPQVGTAGFYIDLGVRDPEKKGRYLLGIECDGAQYHASKTARDRDRLRQAVLESRGWRIHRIWSLDWWSNPERELRRCVEAIENASSTRAPAVSAPVLVEPVERVEGEITAIPPVMPVPPYVVASFPVAEPATGSDSDWAGWIRGVVGVEGPVAIEEVYKRILSMAGVRKGPRVRAGFDRAFVIVLRDGSVVHDGEFLKLPGVLPTLRSRAGLPSGLRSFDLVHPAEIRLAALRAVGESFGASGAEVAAMAARLLGFERATASIVERVQLEIAGLVTSGLVVEQGGRYRLPPRG